MDGLFNDLKRKYDYSVANVINWPEEIIRTHGEKQHKDLVEKSLINIIKQHPGLLQQFSEEPGIEHKLKALNHTGINKPIYQNWHNEGLYSKRAVLKSIAESLIMDKKISINTVFDLMKNKDSNNLIYKVMTDPEEIKQEAIRYETCIAKKNFVFFQNNILDTGQINIKIQYNQTNKGYARFTVLKDEKKEKHLLMQYAAIMDKPKRIIHEALSALAIEVVSELGINSVLSLDKECRYIRLSKDKEITSKFQKIGNKQFRNFYEYDFSGKKEQKLYFVFKKEDVIIN